jgi:hypothetical protein
MDYYWSVYQSEWATDIVFAEADSLRRIMALLVRHGMLSFSSADVMRYFGRRVNQSGDIPANFNGTLETDLKRRQEGERVKYRMNGNSAKFYDKAYSEIGSVLRGAETTINAVQDFRAYRSKEGGPEEEDLQWRPLRKGIADLHRRAEVSQKANERLLNSLASVDDSRSVGELTAGIQKHTHWNGRRVRGVRPWAEDKELFTAINHGEFLINGFRNRDLQKLLYTTEAESQVNRRRRSSTMASMHTSLPSTSWWPANQHVRSIWLRAAISTVLGWANITLMASVMASDSPSVWKRRRLRKAVTMTSRLESP